jgi:hypothetical protein
VSRDDGPWDDEVLVISTETRRGVRERIFFALIFGGGAVFFNLLTIYSPSPTQPFKFWSFVAALIGLDVLLVVIAVGMMIFLARGTWIIDLEGVTYEPCHGRSRRMLWSEVERVQWGGALVLKSDKEKISVWWRMLDDKARDAAEERIRKLLAADFDLDDPFPKPEVSPRTSFRRWAILISSALVVVIPWTAGGLALVTWFPEWKDVLMFWVFMPQFVGFLCGFIMIARQTREYKLIHPAWPWRLRRTKAKLEPADW